jgi:hypothetical protein
MQAMMEPQRDAAQTELHELANEISRVSLHDTGRNYGLMDLLSRTEAALRKAATPAEVKPYRDPMESMLGRPYGQEKADVTCAGAPCGWPTCGCGRGT